MRPGLKDLREIGPEFESRWQEFFVPVPDKPVLALALLAGYCYRYFLNLCTIHNLAELLGQCLGNQQKI